MIQDNKTTGFTLIELMLAMSFVGVLLLAIAVTSMHIMNTYTKGVTIREVNQAGRTISEDIQRSIAASTPFTVTPAKEGGASDATDSMYVHRTDRGGRLCTGTYTYAWNYGSSLKEGADRYNRYEGEAHTVGASSIRLVKVSDMGGALCANPSARINPNTPEFPDRVKELLMGGDRDLAVQELSVTEGARDDASNQGMYAISLTIGTNDQTQLNVTNASCLAPDQGEGFEDFCAINKFNIIARAGNRAGSL